MQKASSPLKPNRLGLFGRRCAALAAGVLATTLVGGPEAFAQQKSKLDVALDIKPLKIGLGEYDSPSASEREKCRMEPSADKTGWVVYDSSGRILRKLTDTNGDKRLDVRSFYKDGIEVYRDIDTDFDSKRKFDHHRWLGPAGMKWAVDQNQDGQIDSWKVISAEEVSYEVVEAIKDRSTGHVAFAALVISDKEIASLGLGQDYTDEIKKRAANARKNASQFIRSQKLIAADSNWVHFGGMRPGIIAAGTNGSKKDVTIYDSVAAVVDNGGRSHGQLSIGTLIKVGDAWRVIDLPEPIIEGQAVANGALFFRSSPSATTIPASTPGPGGEEIQKMYAEYDALEKQLNDARPSEAQKLNAKRAELFVRFVGKTKDSNKSNWVRQMADMVSAAYQEGQYDDGAAFLRNTIKEFEKEGGVEKVDINYCKYRFINSFYSRKIADATQKEVAKIQEEHMGKLKQFVELNPKHPQTADAMLQLAFDDEANGNVNEAKDWYNKIGSDFPQSPIANRAKGAAMRLNSEGRVISFTGKTLDNKSYDLRNQRGKIVLIQYWGTYSETCKSDMRLIKEAYNDYNRRGFEVVSVSLDNNVNELKSYLRQNPLPWTQLYAEGYLDSPLAEQLGITMVPTMILVGDDGKVIDRNVVAADIDRLLSRQFSRSAKRDDKK